MIKILFSHLLVQGEQSGKEHHDSLSKSHHSLIQLECWTHSFWQSQDSLVITKNLRFLNWNLALGTYSSSSQLGDPALSSFQRKFSVVLFTFPHFCCHGDYSKSLLFSLSLKSQNCNIFWHNLARCVAAEGSISIGNLVNY